MADFKPLSQASIQEFMSQAGDITDVLDKQQDQSDKSEALMGLLQDYGERVNRKEMNGALALRRTVALGIYIGVMVSADRREVDELFRLFNMSTAEAS